MHSYKKDNNNRDKGKNSSNKYKSKEFNLRLATCAKAIIIRYKY
jgi:hypothetical protein